MGYQWPQQLHPHPWGDTQKPPWNMVPCYLPSAGQGELLAAPPRLYPAPSSPRPGRASAAETLCQEDGWLLRVLCHQTITLFLPLSGSKPPVCHTLSPCHPLPGDAGSGAGSGGQLGDARLCLGMGAGSTPAWHSLPLGEELDPADPSIPTHTP